MSRRALVKVLQNNLRRALRSAALEEAKALLERLREEDETRGLELEYLIAVGAWADAANLAEQLLQLFPASARIHRGRVCYHEKKYQRAKSHFEQSQRLHPHWRTRH